MAWYPRCMGSPRAFLRKCFATTHGMQASSDVFFSPQLPVDLQSWNGPTTLKPWTNDDVRAAHQAWHEWGCNSIHDYVKAYMKGTALCMLAGKQADRQAGMHEPSLCCVSADVLLLVELTSKLQEASKRWGNLEEGLMCGGFSSLAHFSWFAYHASTITSDGLNLCHFTPRTRTWDFLSGKSSGAPPTASYSFHVFQTLRSEV